jgi:hypothetical protein
MMNAQVAREGFEPPFPDSKSGVLPLDDLATMLNYRPQKPKARGFVCKPPRSAVKPIQPITGDNTCQLAACAGNRRHAGPGMPCTNHRTADTDQPPVLSVISDAVLVPPPWWSQYTSQVRDRQVAFWSEHMEAGAASAPHPPITLESPVTGDDIIPLYCYSRSKNPGGTPRLLNRIERRDVP